MSTGWNVGSVVVDVIRCSPALEKGSDRTGGEVRVCDIGENGVYCDDATDGERGSISVWMLLPMGLLPCVALDL